MRGTTYRGYHITASAYSGFDFAADDYDGPEDSRCGHGATEADCRAQIDEMEGCNHNWKFIKSWGGDPSIPNGTFDCSFYQCTKCDEEQDSEPADFVAEEPDETAYMDKVRGIDD